MEAQIVFLYRLAGIFIRSFFMGYTLLILWFLIFIFEPDWMYRLQSQWFEMSRSSFNIIHYCGMGLLKISLIVFFLFPYLAIRMILRKKE